MYEREKSKQTIFPTASHTLNSRSHMNCVVEEILRFFSMKNTYLKFVSLHLAFFIDVYQKEEKVFNGTLI